MSVLHTVFQVQTLALSHLLKHTHTHTHTQKHANTSTHKHILTHDHTPQYAQGGDTTVSTTNANPNASEEPLISFDAVTTGQSTNENNNISSTCAADTEELQRLREEVAKCVLFESFPFSFLSSFLFRWEGAPLLLLFARCSLSLSLSWKKLYVPILTKLLSICMRVCICVVRMYV